MSRQNGSLDDVGSENSNVSCIVFKVSANSDYYDHVDEGRAAISVDNKNDREIREFSNSSMTRIEDGLSDRRNGYSKESSAAISDDHIELTEDSAQTNQSVSLYDAISNDHIEFIQEPKVCM